MGNTLVSRILKKYIQPGFRVAELYHGEKPDLLLIMSALVGQTGLVYGIDELNPFLHHSQMKVLQNVPNIKLITANVPPLPPEATNLDAILIREFLFAYEDYPKESHEINASISSTIKPGGYLILCLNSTEQDHIRNGDTRYEKTISHYPHKFRKVYYKGQLLIFQKE